MFRYFKSQQTEINFLNGYVCSDNKSVKLWSNGSRSHFKEIYLKCPGTTHLTLYLKFEDGNQEFLDPNKYRELLPNITHFFCFYDQIRKLSDKQLSTLASIFPNVAHLIFLDPNKVEMNINPLIKRKIENLFNIRGEVPSLANQCAFFISENNIPITFQCEELQEKIMQFTPF